MAERATRYPRALAEAETTSVNFGLGNGEEEPRRWLDRRRVACNLVHPRASSWGSRLIVPHVSWETPASLSRRWMCFVVSACDCQNFPWTG